jgi:hypothetical protein
MDGAGPDILSRNKNEVEASHGKELVFGLIVQEEESNL